jgi:hypothetical protein
VKTYQRYKNALEKIVQSTSVKEAKALAEEALCIDGRKAICAQCKRATVNGEFCSAACRKRYVKRLSQARQPTLRDVQALELRESGMTYREIGRMFGVCNETAEDMRFGHLSNGVCVTFRRLKPPGDIPCANE